MWRSDVPGVGDIRKDINLLGISGEGRDIFDHLCCRHAKHIEVQEMLKALDDADKGRYFRVPGDRYDKQQHFLR